MTIYIYVYNYDSDISIPYFLSGLGVRGGCSIWTGVWDQTMIKHLAKNAIDFVENQ